MTTDSTAIEKPIRNKRNKESAETGLDMTKERLQQNTDAWLTDRKG